MPKEILFIPFNTFGIYNHKLLVFHFKGSILSIDRGFLLRMAIEPEVISPSIKKGSRASRYLPKWVMYSAAGVGVLILVGLIKALLPVIGMAFLLTFIWSQSTINRR